MPDYEIIRPRQVTRWSRVKDALRSITLGPFNPKDPAIARYFGGRASATGIQVNEESSLTFSAVWNAVVLVSGDIAKVPLPLYKRLENGGKDVFRTHPLYELIHDEPNPEMSSFVFRRTLQGHVLTWGNGYAEIERDGAGRPVALWPLLPWSVTPLRERGELRYRVTQPSGGHIFLERQDMLHLSGFGLDGITGYPPILKAMESIGLGLATEKFGATFFGNGSTFGGVISYEPGTSTNPQVREENRKAIENRHQGVDRSHRFLVLYEGAKYQQLGIAPNEAQFLETRRFQIEEVARWFNIPVHKLKELARSTNNNIEHQGIEYATDTLQPWFRMWEGELRLKLIPRLERRQQFFEHVTEALTRGDSAAQGDLIGKQFSVGGISPNEIRSKFNMNPDPHGDGIYVPSNMMPADLARKYWEAQIEEHEAKAEAAKRPPEPPPVAKTDSAEDEIKALQAALVEARKATQLAEDLRDLAVAERDGERQTIATITAQHAADLAVKDEEARQLRKACDWYALDAHERGIALDLSAQEVGTLKTERDSAMDRVEKMHVELNHARTDATDYRAQRERAETERDTAVALVAVAEQERDAANRDALAQAESVALAEAARKAAVEAAALSEAATERAMAEVGSLAMEAETLKTDLARARADLATELEKARVFKATMLAAMRSLFAEATVRLLAKESNAARKQQATAEKLRAWVDRFYPLHVETARDVFRPLVGPWTAIAGGAPNLLLDRLVAEHVSQSRIALELVAEADSDDERAMALERTLSRWESERGDAMADALLREGMAGHGSD